MSEIKVEEPEKYISEVIDKYYNFIFSLMYLEYLILTTQICMNIRYHRLKSESETMKIDKSILKHISEDEFFDMYINKSLLKEKDEIELYESLRKNYVKIYTLTKVDSNFVDAIKLYSEIISKAKNFLDNIRILVEDKDLRFNRLTLCLLAYDSGQNICDWTAIEKRKVV